MKLNRKTLRVGAIVSFIICCGGAIANIEPIASGSFGSFATLLWISVAVED